MAKACRLIFAACGTSWHSGLIGKYAIASVALILPQQLGFYQILSCQRWEKHLDKPSYGTYAHLGYERGLVLYTYIYTRIWGFS